MRNIMNETPKGLRTHIAILGKRNAGKSTFVNALSGQEVSIVSPQPGTTTDPVEKTLELLPLGPVVLHDTAGIDDSGKLGKLRVARSMAVIKRADACIIICRGGEWTPSEEEISNFLNEKKIPYLIVRNQNETTKKPCEDIEPWRKKYNLKENIPVIDIVATREFDKRAVANLLENILRDDQELSRALANDLVPTNGLAILVIPLDTGAPKGRLILPQVQTIRDMLDGERFSLITTGEKYPEALKKLAGYPDLVICDSQIVDLVEQNTPANIPLTTFSILMARFKGDLTELARGAGALKNLKPGDSILIQEACSHHPQNDDIGRVKIPNILKKMTGGELDIEWSAGKEMADYKKDFKAIIHCGACVITKRQMLARMQLACEKNIPITNYGMTIAFARGILERTLSPFPEALAAFRES